LADDFRSPATTRFHVDSPFQNLFALKQKFTLRSAIKNLSTRRAKFFRAGRGKKTIRASISAAKIFLKKLLRTP